MPPAQSSIFQNGVIGKHWLFGELCIAGGLQEDLNDCPDRQLSARWFRGDVLGE
jgi:hypothetical protein